MLDFNSNNEESSIKNAVERSLCIEDDGIGSAEDDEDDYSSSNGDEISKQRIVIVPDAYSLGRLLNFDEDDDEEEDVKTVNQHLYKTDNFEKKSSGWHKKVGRDLSRHSNSFHLERRHSIGICEYVSDTSFLSSSSSSNLIRPDYSFVSPLEEKQLKVSEILTCDLQFEEVAHIRNTLSKARLESLSIGAMKTNIEKGKLCFLCLKTKFGLFHRGQPCQMCKQVVCTSCYSKMRISRGHFTATPVSAISPKTSQDNENKRLINFESNSVGSVPNSPKSSRSHLSRTLLHFSESSSRPVSHPYATLPKSRGKNFGNNWKQLETLEREKEELKGSLLIVCLSCKTLVVEVIKAYNRKRK